MEANGELPTWIHAIGYFSVHELKILRNWCTAAINFLERKKIAKRK